MASLHYIMEAILLKPMLVWFTMKGIWLDLVELVKLKLWIFMETLVSS